MFQVGKPVTSQDFFDRSAILKEVELLIANRQNFMIKAPRRYGKTSLIKQAMQGKDTHFLYLDIRRESRLENIAEQITEFAFSLAGIEGFFRRLRENVMRFITSAHHELKVKTELLEYSVEFFTDDKKSNCERVIHALQTVEKIAAEMYLDLFIVFDEFQDVQRFECNGDILEMLRGELQHQDRVTYAFLGSLEHLMTQIFENRKSPFYNFCRKLQLKPFDIEELQPQLIAAFKSKKIVFEDPAALNDVLHRLNGHPSNTMLVMQKLYYLALERDVPMVDVKMVHAAYDNAYGESLDLIEQYVIELKGRKHFYDVLCRLARGEEQALKAQALNQVYKGLIELGFIANVARGEYVIHDGFLVEYARGVE